jgi:hypothetical protein
MPFLALLAFRVRLRSTFQVDRHAPADRLINLYWIGGTLAPRAQTCETRFIEQISQAIAVIE